MQNNGKSRGNDDLSSEIIKTSYEWISPFIFAMYYRMCQNGEYPERLGKGIITQIFKNGNNNDADNYRGITLINVLANFIRKQY